MSKIITETFNAKERDTVVRAQFRYQSGRQARLRHNHLNGRHKDQPAIKCPLCALRATPLVNRVERN